MEEVSICIRTSQLICETPSICKLGVRRLLLTQWCLHKRSHGCWGNAQVRIYITTDYWILLELIWEDWESKVLLTHWCLPR